jgi:hypothetical protein
MDVGADGNGDGGWRKVSKTASLWQGEGTEYGYTSNGIRYQQYSSRSARSTLSGILMLSGVTFRTRRRDYDRRGYGTSTRKGGGEWGAARHGDGLRPGDIDGDVKGGLARFLVPPSAKRAWDD